VVLLIGGVGLLFGPGGRPLGFFETSGVDPNSMMAVVFLCLDGGDEPAGPGGAAERLGTLRALCSESSSSEVWESSRPWEREIALP
jgi:hypothetical protein